MFHLLDRHTTGVGNISRRTHRSARITRSWLHEQLFDFRAGNDFLVQLDVQRTAACKRDLAGFLEDVTQIVIHHLQRQLFEQRLHARGVVDVRLVSNVAFALRPQPLISFGEK